MATTTENSRIINHWSLIMFSELKGDDMRVGTCTAKDGTKFPAVAFNDGKNRTFVDFGSSLEGGLTFEEICAQADDLQIVELETLPEVLERRKAAGKQLETYKLCKVGEFSWKGGSLKAALGRR